MYGRCGSITHNDEKTIKKKKSSGTNAKEGREFGKRKRTIQTGKKKNKKRISPDTENRHRSTERPEMLSCFYFCTLGM